MKNLTTLMSLLLLIFSGCQTDKTWTDEDIQTYWTSGKTLPAEVLRQFPLPPQKLTNDTGFNVLIDMAHECNFHILWTLPEQLNKLGYRSIGSHATLHTTLDPDGESRIRMVYDTINKVHPFVWMPNPAYQVIITTQHNQKSQMYSREELASLTDFLKNGGGLLVQGASACHFLNENLDIHIDLNTKQVAEMGKGRIWFAQSGDEFKYPNKATPDQKETVDSALHDALKWLAGNQKPLKDEPRYPEPMWGGGGIYPELEDSFNNIVFYWAANQKEELLKTVTEDVPKAQSFIGERLPSKPTAEPMYLILCAGSGGGWAVNAYRPKENGIISLDSHGILSIFGHELAHTMHGPVNEDGEVAGISPIPNRGEAHAGWFQGKVNALFKEELRDQANRNCNTMFDWDPTGSALDLATHYENEALQKEWGKGKDWVKTWYIWQKLDDHYGPTWYPAWKYVQHTRWKDTPEHRLSWEEMIEDMSIAVGEDLFPFFIQLGTSLDRDRMEQIEYKGETMNLAVAPIEVTPAGSVRMEEIGTYTR